jgi:hypothetical protein
VRWVMKGGAVVVDRTRSNGSDGSRRSDGSGGLVRSGSDGFAGQSGPGADAKAIQDVVERFLLHLGDHEFDKVAADLAPKAIVIVTRQRDGQWSNSYQTGDEWVAALKQNPNPITFREPISNVVVTVDSDRLAYLRADFQVARDGRALSKGVDQFTLVREPSGWKLAVIAYTSMPIP